MTLPTTGPTSREAVKAALELSDARDDDRIDAIVAAVNRKVRGFPIAERVAADYPDQVAADDPDTGGWPADITEGATMLAGRLWRRKDSPAGVAAFGDFGPVYVQRNDPDIAMLLELGDYARPAVG